MDETSGTNANDLGTAATTGGTYTGGITLGQLSVSPRLGRAAYFDGNAGTWLDLGLFHPGNSVSLEAWVNLDATASATFKAIIARWDGSYEMDTTGTDVPNLVIRSTNNPSALGLVAPASGAIRRGQWYHFVSVYHAGMMIFYVN